MDQSPASLTLGRHTSLSSCDYVRCITCSEIAFDLLAAGMLIEGPEHHISTNSAEYRLVISAPEEGTRYVGTTIKLIILVPQN
jgi:hypothetical protein